jgi:hypothetical protein
MILNHAQPCVSKVQNNPERIFSQYLTHPGNLESALISCSYLVLFISSLFFLFFGLEKDGTAGLYFAVVTLTTAGLGDFVPTTDANKIICSIHLFGVACNGLLLGLYIVGMLTMPIAAKAKQINAQIALGFKRLEKQPR